MTMRAVFYVLLNFYEAIRAYLVLAWTAIVGTLMKLHLVIDEYVIKRSGNVRIVYVRASCLDIQHLTHMVRLYFMNHGVYSCIGLRKHLGLNAGVLTIVYGIADELYVSRIDLGNERELYTQTQLEFGNADLVDMPGMAAEWSKPAWHQRAI